jgi:hypothetical protein
MNNGSDFSTDPLNSAGNAGNVVDPQNQFIDQLQTTGLVGPSNNPLMDSISPPIRVKQDSEGPKKIDFGQLVIKKV